MNRVSQVGILLKPAHSLKESRSLKSFLFKLWLIVIGVLANTKFFSLLFYLFMCNCFFFQFGKASLIMILATKKNKKRLSLHRQQLLAKFSILCHWFNLLFQLTFWVSLWYNAVIKASSNISTMETIFSMYYLTFLFTSTLEWYWILIWVSRSLHSSSTYKL